MPRAKPRVAWGGPGTGGLMSRSALKDLLLVFVFLACDRVMVLLVPVFPLFCSVFVAFCWFVSRVIYWSRY